jgi:DNA polymerase III subunit beta
MMKFTAERQALLAAVKRASSIIQSRNVIPALACVRLEATDTGLHAHATNLDEWARVTCEAAVSAQGSICVNAALLLAWLNAAPKGALVAFEVHEYRAYVSAGRLSADFATLPATDMPTHDAPADLVEVADAIPALTMCLPYVATDDVQYYLLGVAVNRGHVVALDGHKACSVDIGADEAISVIIPTAAVRQIIACTSSARIFVNEYQWACEDEGIRLGGKQIDGEFPDWTRVMGSEVEAVQAIDCDALQEAVTGVKMADDNRGQCVRLVGKAGEISVSSRGSGAQAAAMLSYEGPDFETAFNPKNLEPALATFSGRIATVSCDPAQALFTCDAMPSVRVKVMGMRA